MNCPNCQTPLPPDVAFCPECGYQLVQEQPEPTESEPTYVPEQPGYPPEQPTTPPQPTPAAPKKDSSKVLIAIIAVLVVVIIVGAAMLFMNKDQGGDTQPATEPATTLSSFGDNTAAANADVTPSDNNTASADNGPTNVTMPDKIAAAKCMDELSPAARIIGAVNTIVNEDGKLVGHMTDGIGFVDNLRDHGVDVKGKKVTIAGGGGAATAIQVQLALDGAKKISIFNIKDNFFQRTVDMAAKIKAEVPSCDINVYDLADVSKMTEEIRDSDIMINATIVGMKPMDDQSVVKDLSAFHDGLVVADTVYNPEETKLLREAREHGLLTVNGKGMLLWQGVAAFKLYTGEDMPVDEVKKLFFS